MRYFHKKPLTITVCSGVAVLAIIGILKILGNHSSVLIAVLSGVLFAAGVVFAVLYISAYSTETLDDEIWDIGFSAALKRIPHFYRGAYKRNLLALNFYLWVALAILCPYIILLH